MCEPVSGSLFWQAEAIFYDPLEFPTETSKYGHNAFLWSWLIRSICVLQSANIADQGKRIVSFSYF